MEQRSQRDMKDIINIKKLIHDYQKYNEITAELEDLNNKLEELMMEWEELSEEMNT